MEIKSGKGKDYPPLIKDLVKELLKDDFVHFKILCANEVHHFNKEEDTIIEERDGDEVRYYGGARICPEGTEVINPAFDITPKELITGIITEKGIIDPI